MKKTEKIVERSTTLKKVALFLKLEKALTMVVCRENFFYLFFISLNIHDSQDSWGRRETNSTSSLSLPFASLTLKH